MRLGLPYEKLSIPDDISQREKDVIETLNSERNVVTEGSFKKFISLVMTDAVLCSREQENDKNYDDESQGL